ncbi:MAG: autotransporter outer membrane beta-barrel domain-containing protein [Rhodocyclaceae bacterium]|nr:autotransporter outer membrane beta-barrel domain-containing protein [Rhodocyclaceae bacterium]
MNQIKRAGCQAIVLSAALGTIATTLHPDWRQLVAESYKSAVERAEEAGKRQKEDVEDRLEELKKEKKEKKDSGGSAGETSPLAPAGMFVNATYSEIDRDTRREPGYEAKIKALTVGGDMYLRNNLLVGVAVTVNRDDTTYVDRLGDLDTDAVAVGLYGTYNPTDTTFIDMIAGYGWLDYDGRRNVPNDVAEASYDGRRLNFGVTFGKDWYSGRYSYGPRFKYTYSKTKIDSFTETAANLNNALDIEGYDVESNLAEIGVTGATVFSQTWGVLSTQASLFYQHEFSNDAQLIHLTNVGTGTPSTFLTDDPDRDVFLGSLGVVAIREQGFQIYGNVEKLFGHSYMDRWTINGGVRIEF